MPQLGAGELCRVHAARKSAMEMGEPREERPELFVEELWRDNPYALHVPTTSFRTIQCDKDRFLVAEALSNITKEGAARMLLPDEQAPPWKPLQQQSKKRKKKKISMRKRMELPRRRIGPMTHR